MRRIEYLYIFFFQNYINMSNIDFANLTSDPSFSSENEEIENEQRLKEPGPDPIPKKRQIVRYHPTDTSRPPLIKHSRVETYEFLTKILTDTYNYNERLLLKYGERPNKNTVSSGELSGYYAVLNRIARSLFERYDDFQDTFDLIKRFEVWSDPKNKTDFFDWLSKFFEKISPDYMKATYDKFRAFLNALCQKIMKFDTIEDFRLYRGMITQMYRKNIRQNKSFESSRRMPSDIEDIRILFKDITDKHQNGLLFIFMLLCATGLRMSEAMKVKRKHFQYDEARDEYYLDISGLSKTGINEDHIYLHHTFIFTFQDFLFFRNQSTEDLEKPLINKTASTLERYWTKIKKDLHLTTKQSFTIRNFTRKRSARNIMLYTGSSNLAQVFLRHTENSKITKLYIMNRQSIYKDAETIDQLKEEIVDIPKDISVFELSYILACNLYL